MVTAAGRYHAALKVSFLSAASHTGVDLLILLRMALVAVQALESMCKRSSCLHHRVKEAVKQAQLYRAVLSGWGFNFIQMCPQLLVFSLPIYSSSFFPVFFWIWLYLKEGTQIKTSLLEAPSHVTKRSVKAK